MDSITDVTLMSDFTFHALGRTAARRGHARQRSAAVTSNTV